VVDDLFAVTPEALQAIWQLLGGYDNVRTITWGNAAPDDPLPHMLVEPRMLNARIRDGIMARLVNVDDALALRPYGTDAVLRFELDDDVCPWNSGRWELVTTRDGGEAKPTSASPDLRLAPDVLAMIAFGRISATDAARAGLAQVEDERALARWDAAMKTKHFPHESEHTW
jgi:predicted acetyltransferase